LFCWLGLINFFSTPTEWRLLSVNTDGMEALERQHGWILAELSLLDCSDYKKKNLLEERKLWVFF